MYLIRGISSNDKIKNNAKINNIFAQNFRQNKNTKKHRFFWDKIVPLKTKCA